MSEVGELARFAPLLQILVLCAFGVAFLRGNRHKQMDEAAAATISIQEAEIVALNQKAERHEREAVECKTETARLQGIVEQLQRENETFRQLVMGERLPTAMQEALSGIAESVVDKIDAAAQRNLETYAGFMRSMEQEYLRPMKDVLAQTDRRRRDEGNPDGDDRRRKGGGG